jgi:opacity protein-like surface antigen
MNTSGMKLGLGSLVAMLLLLTTLSAPVAADGLRVGVGGAHNTVATGEFNGENVLKRYDYGSSSYQYLDLPTPEDMAMGFAGRVDYIKGYWGAELQYSTFSHSKDATGLFNEPQGTMTYHFVDFNAKLVIPVMLAELQLIAGLNYTLLNIEKGELFSDTELVSKVDYDYDPRISQADFQGFGVNLGIGLSYNFMPFVSIFAEYIIRSASFSVANDLEIAELIESGVIDSIIIGITYDIPMGFY